MFLKRNQGNSFIEVFFKYIKRLLEVDGGIGLLAAGVVLHLQERTVYFY
jgi:hypothetical protein